MTIGSSIFLIAVGAILRFAVTATVGGFDIATAGTILMVVGVVGLIIGLFMIVSTQNRQDEVVTRREVPRDRDVL